MSGGSRFGSARFSGRGSWQEDRKSMPVSRAPGVAARESRVALETNTCETTMLRVLGLCEEPNDGPEADWTCHLRS